MPAILVELGFVSNPAEEARLKDSAYRDRMVDALARAIQGLPAEDRLPAVIR
jgi:N-acetylmuramoyl-L-alanine amidase